MSLCLANDLRASPATGRELCSGNLGTDAAPQKPNDSFVDICTEEWDLSDLLANDLFESFFHQLNCHIGSREEIKTYSIICQ